jgi:hypothetical protein
VLQDLFEGAMRCISGGALENELRRREKASALAFLLVVERLERAVRVSDVLREVIAEYACFDLIENAVEDSSGAAASDDSSAGWSSDDSGDEANDWY